MSNDKRALIAAAIFFLTAASCIAPSSTQCSDGRVCPSGEVCVPGGGCATPDELVVCLGKMDGATCVLSAGAGHCRSGSCALGAGCGDGIVEEGEVCDDGNTKSGDGCRGDCLKVEVCGDGIVDANEACDDGNTNPQDGCDACKLTAWSATVLVGQGSASAHSTDLNFPDGMALDGRGNLYFADENDRVYGVELATGVVSLIAGSGAEGYSGENVAAASAAIFDPSGVAVDGLGNIYFAEWSGSLIAGAGNRVRKVTATTGLISTVAGYGVMGFGGDGAPAVTAKFSSAAGVVIDGLGNFYIADSLNHRVRRVDATSGIISTVAGTGVNGFNGDAVPGVSAELDDPRGIALDRSGNLYIADTQNNRIRRLDATTGIISTVAGTGLASFFGDHGAATAAQLAGPQAIAVDRTGTLFIADSTNARIRRVDGTTGVITTIAGSGPGPVASDDGGPATNAVLNNPSAVVVDDAGNVYLGDDSHRIRKVDATTGIITTIVGTGAEGYSGEGGAATSAPLGDPSGMTTDAAGNVYVTSIGNELVRKIDASSGVIHTIAGTNVAGAGGDGGLATSAQLSFPYGVAVSPSGDVYIADSSNYRIRRIDAKSGLISTFAGTGVAGYSGDGGAATSAQLDFSGYVAVDGLGNVYIGAMYTGRVRKVDAISGIISTLAGTGVSGYSGDGGLATSAQINPPTALFADRLGNVYVGDTTTHRVRRIDAASGVISTFAGTGVSGNSGDGGAATAAQIVSPGALAVDGLGNVYISDRFSERLRKVDGSGMISTVAGTSTGNPNGDGGPATNAILDDQYGLGVDGLGNIYILNYTDARIRKLVVATGLFLPVAGPLEPPGMGPITVARLGDPRALVLAPGFSLVAGGTTGTVEAIRTAAGTLEAVAGRYNQDNANTANLARFRTNAFGTVNGVAYDATNGLIYLSETSSNHVQVVTTVDPADANTWTIALLAGDPIGVTAGFVDGAVSTARFNQPGGLFLDASTHTLYVADAGNHALRAIDLSAGLAAATVSTIAGTPTMAGTSGDGGPATAARLSSPQAITRCGNGDLFIADTGNNRVRRIDDSTGLMSTVLGDNVAASAGQGSPAASFPVDTPLGLACDTLGNLFVTSRTTVRLLPADATGIVDGTGSVETIFGAPPRDTYPASSSACLTGLAIVDDKTVQITDSCAGLLIELARQTLP